ncbi:NYN domain-containing protein [Polaromonas eurypsychrophila]|uniref:NYN domain-containing protein n=1 Tax=Polaromonas eurypsychrophila TaxID=1614635 RepID=A0A916SDN0_9BURK|nr:NYN domain-containing protein [Polaromonas eurypsychrophila]GGA95001.1 hypothetical protein GCM10011496_15120 [Polaromonas eurypsychrophila]
MVVFLIDADNLSSPAWIEEAFRELESEGEISVRRAYGSAENLRGLAEVLRVLAVRPFVNLYLTKNTTDLALAVDAMELACQTPKPQTIVIGSGDADFVPLLVRLRERGIRLVCVSEQSKMASEAISAYHRVIHVGQNKGTQTRQLSSTPGKPSTLAPKKAVAKKVPAKKIAEKPVAAKKAALKKVVEKSATGAPGDVSVQRILEVVPGLRSEKFLRLGDVAKLLHDAKLLGKNSATPKLFKKFPHHFELAPAKQPNEVRYIPSSR